MLQIETFELTADGLSRSVTVTAQKLDQMLQIEMFELTADGLSRSVTVTAQKLDQMLQIEMIGWDGPSVNQLPSSVAKCHTLILY